MQRNRKRQYVSQYANSLRSISLHTQTGWTTTTRDCRKNNLCASGDGRTHCKEQSKSLVSRSFLPFPAPMDPPLQVSYTKIICIHVRSQIVYRARTVGLKGFVRSWHRLQASLPIGKRTWCAHRARGLEPDLSTPHNLISGKLLQSERREGEEHFSFHPLSRGKIKTTNKRK